jgi:hypothetical protein
MFKFSYKQSKHCPDIDLVKGLQVLIKVLELKVKKTHDYESKKFQVS